MMPIDRPLIASIFSVGQGGYCDTVPALPPNALVIVIQDKPEALILPPPSQRPNYHRAQIELSPVCRGKAGKAYAEQSPGRLPVVNVAG